MNATPVEPVDKDRVIERLRSRIVDLEKLINEQELLRKQLEGELSVRNCELANAALKIQYHG